MFNTNFGIFFCHSLVLFLFPSCNKILLESCFTHVVFLFLFFLFHNLNLELGLPLFLSWLGNHVNLVVFVFVTLTMACNTTP
jgi:hypothetical protein